MVKFDKIYSKLSYSSFKVQYFTTENSDYYMFFPKLKRSLLKIVNFGFSYKDINPERRKMDIRDQYLDIQLGDKHLRYSILISKIFILTYFNILDSKAECSDTTTEYIRCLSLS